MSRLQASRLAVLAQSRMGRSLNCPAEDALDGDQRHRRYYLVNSYRAKLLSLEDADPPPVVSSWPRDDGDGLEPLEDLLDWDSNTRRV